MSWKIWKKPEERLREEWDKAVSLRNQGKWSDAANHFLSAANLEEEVAGRQSTKQALIARALAALYKAVGSRTGDDLSICHDAMAKLDPETSLDIPNKVRAGDVAQEAALLAVEARLPQVSLQNLEGFPDETADKFEALAQSYLGLGREKLVLGSLFGIDSSSDRLAFKSLGLSKLLKGSAEEERDPSKAVEYYAEAMGNFGQAMLEEYRGYLDDRNRKLGSVAKCWFCGRDVQGEEVQYVYMETILTPYLREKYGSESPPSVNELGIAACLACYEAIHKMADLVARKYYQMAMAELRAVEKKLWENMLTLEKRLSRVEDLAHRHG
ncbi:MAG TPA: hypothetical protein VJ249_01015 [Candidatus Bathyarchaeia archaeon]|nr:hypothetical protein [Candidatus Bathyarchaeia archaeon]